MSKNINTYHVKALKILILSPNVKLRGLTHPLLCDHMVNLKKIKVNFSKEKNDVLLLRQEMAEMSRIFTLFLGQQLTQISACFIRIFDSFFRLLVASVMKGMAEKGVGLDFEATRGW